MRRFLRQYSRCRSVSYVLGLPNEPSVVVTGLLLGRSSRADLPFELRGDLRFEVLQVADDPAHFLGTMPVHVDAGKLVPAVRAHRVQLGVLLERQRRL